HRPEGGRHHAGRVGCHRDRNCNQQEGARVFPPMPHSQRRRQTKSCHHSVTPTLKLRGRPEAPTKHPCARCFLRPARNHLPFTDPSDDCWSAPNADNAASGPLSLPRRAISHASPDQEPPQSHHYHRGNDLVEPIPLQETSAENDHANDSHSKPNDRLHFS